MGYFSSRIGAPRSNIIVKIRKSRSEEKQENDNELNQDRLQIHESRYAYCDITGPLSFNGSIELYEHMKKIARGNETTIALNIMQPMYDRRFQQFITTHNGLPEQAPITRAQTGKPLIFSTYVALDPFAVLKEMIDIDDVV